MVAEQPKLRTGVSDATGQSYRTLSAYENSCKCIRLRDVFELCSHCREHLNDLAMKIHSKQSVLIPRRGNDTRVEEQRTEECVGSMKATDGKPLSIISGVVVCLCLSLLWFAQAGKTPEGTQSQPPEASVQVAKGIARFLSATKAASKREEVKRLASVERRPSRVDDGMANPLLMH